MNEYRISLALTYFKEKKEHYTIGELAEILGYNYTQINELIELLLEQGYIDYNNELIAITSKGIRFLISNDTDSICLQADKIVTPHIDPSTAWPINAPYVPVGFSEKIKR